MATVRLPYFAVDGRASPPRRPPVTSLRPAVVIPLSVGALAVALATLAAVPQTEASTPAADVSALPLAANREIQLAEEFPPSVQAWAGDIHRWAQAYDLPPELISVVMTIESCGDPRARSSAGALGLFQVMPFHFAENEDALNPEVNARRGLTYLSRGLDLAQGDVRQALAGYNGGHGVIGRDPSSWAAETRRYESWGTGILADLSAGRRPSPTLQAWLDAGGQHLCRRAEG